jgi:hypothetical protein
MLATLSFMMIENDNEYSLNSNVKLARNRISAVSRARCALVLFAEGAACDVDFEFRLQLALLAHEK